jgi:asparagine synthase (glutamine-hydrolyzing)
MCGFVGFIDYSKESSQEFLVKMCNVIQHRGPDAENYFFEEHNDFQIGLGHRRLSIIDLHTTANQPMFYKNWVIVFNGEIYNYQEIKNELMSLGHTFDTNSDTEVILHCFEEWNAKGVDKFIGMFAFLLFNRKTNEIFTVRDRPGVKPLHIYKNENIIMWASEIKSFHQHPLFKKELDLDSVKSFIQLGYVPFPHSILKNVYKQKPGTITKYDLDKKSSNVIEYWNVNSFYEQDVKNITFDEAKNELKELLGSACNYRMVSDVPVGVFLSGGYDSTLVASILQSERSEKIKTFTIGINDPKINEAQFAREIANILGTDHTEVYLSENEMFEQLDDFVFYYDEPFGDSSAIPTMLVSKIAKQQVSVALSADGGDELFAGYNRYEHISILNKIRKLRKIPFAKEVLPLIIKEQHEKDRMYRLLYAPNAITLAKTLNNPYYPEEINKLFLQKISNEQIDSLGKNLKSSDDLRTMLSFDYQTYLLNDILVKVDRATMRYSIEGREPLLDHRLLEYASNLPNDFKIKNGVKKFILKDIVHDYISKELMERPKMGFAAPVDHWLKNNLKDRLEFFLSKSYIESQDIFSYEYISQIKTDYYQGKNRYALKLWYILVFQMWYQKWILDEN